MSEILIEGFSAEEAFKALCESNEASLPSADAEYYIVIANELAFDLEFYAKLVNREELVSEITRYIELDRFNTTADILLGLQEDEFEKSIEDLCMAATGEAYLEDVGILIKNKAGKVISGIDFTLSLIDELQDYEAGNDVIQKLKNQEPFTFTFERDVNDYGDFVAEGVDFEDAFHSLNVDNDAEIQTGDIIVFNGVGIDNFDYSKINIEDSVEIGIHCGTEKCVKDLNKYRYINKLMLKSPKILHVGADMSGYWSDMSMADRLKRISLIDDQEYRNLIAAMRLNAGEISELKYKKNSTCIRDLVIKHGYNVISYINESEDPGSVSYIILDPTIISKLN